MPRKPSGLPQWKPVAFKLPDHLYDELRRFADLHHTSISDVLREGLQLRMHGTADPEAYNGITPTHEKSYNRYTVSPQTSAAVAAQLRHLATLLEGQEEPDTAPDERHATPVVTMSTKAPEAVQKAPESSSAPAPDYDTTRFVLGDLCSKGHDYRGTGKSLRRLQAGGKSAECVECMRLRKQASRQRRREAQQTHT